MIAKTRMPLTAHNIVHHPNILDFLQHYRENDPVYVLYPSRLEEDSKEFLSIFPGNTLYAVKANPHPFVLQKIWDTGVRHFDVASPRELDRVHALFPEANIFLMHPVKSRSFIRRGLTLGAYDFAFDHEDELDKIVTEFGVVKSSRSLKQKHPNLHLRIDVTSGEHDAKAGSRSKFGADAEQAVSLLKKARPFSDKLGVCFLIGSQVDRPCAYANAIDLVHSIVASSKIPIDRVNVGGGFPVSYPGRDVDPLADYVGAILSRFAQFNLSKECLFAEPGRALCARGGSTLARVELRKERCLYLNDGAFGSLYDAKYLDWVFPVKRWRLGKTVEPVGDVPFQFYGPTCDSIDKMAGPFFLPDDVCEGDWIEIKNLGAYGQTMATRFNGFYGTTTVVIGDP